MKREKVVIMVIIGVVIIVLAVSGYIYYSKYLSHTRIRGEFGKEFNGTRENFPINESEISEVTQFFNSNPSSDEISSYCNEKRVNCFYFCRTVNPDAEFCKNFLNNSRREPMQNPPEGRPLE